ncbi:MAG: histone deacetylase family protein [Alphaproteobacteria bacterium]|nr:histone deacetylase family protein [Alphaproteobacteria bacterium]
MIDAVTPAWFHPAQLAFKPRYEWAFGERIDHPETTARAESILAALRDSDRFAVEEPPPVPPGTLSAQHNGNLLALYRTASALPEGETFYPTVFPKRDQVQADPTRISHAGAFCFDAGTPLSSQTWEAARWSASCAWAAARALKKRRLPLTYALSRPPGHHATGKAFGGYCYLNNAAIAVSALLRGARVTVLDIDVHHGNGTQSLFYRNPRVQVVSIHEHPDACFPYFAGFPNETGAGAGSGTTLNVTEAAGCDGPRYMELLERHALPAIRAFAPDYLVLSAGLDTYALDPVGHFQLTTDDLREVGERIGRLGLPTVAVQEGGYHTEHLGRNAVALLDGLRTTLG